MYITLGNIVSSALFALSKPTNGKEYAWLMSRAVTYLKSYAPIDGNVKTEVLRLSLGNSARVFDWPQDAMRISMIGYECGNRHYSLDVDNSLSLPENFFSCNNTNVSVGSADMPSWAEDCERYTTSEPAYRIKDNKIIFSSNIPSGKVYIEYLSNGKNINKNTIVDNAYFAPIERWLMAEFVLLLGSKDEKALYRDLIAQSDALQYNANTLLKVERLDELIQADGKY